MARSALLNVMVQAATKAARALSRDFGEVENLQVSMKGPGDFVSAADLRAEKILREELSRVRPKYGFLMEESGEIEGTDKAHRWIVDPLDGTTNFLHAVPLFTISIALERDGEIVAGLVFTPIMNELFVAEKGAGAYLNDRRIRVAQRRDLSQSIITTGIPHQGRGNHPAYLRELAPIMAKSAGIRRTGSAALDLAWLAAGRFDGFFERGLSLWDIAAGVLLVSEAGGFATDYTGRKSALHADSLVAGNVDIHRALVDSLSKS
ncbi:inositol monophosphatase family protein [Microbaculum sp. FT89]|uniref:inositol monophosphatase family protein n=1 Tax=Microbaculum sp. FT89 TaxID=3447298 RepID=UPI003F52D556